MTSPEASVGCLLGTAIGDAIGLPYESISRRRGVRLLGSPDRHRLLGRWGLLSDDTEHAAFTATALIVSAGDVRVFEQALAWRLRGWIASLPLVTGKATALAGFKLLIGVPPRWSGVFSAGNGPAMRAAILGAAVAEETRLRDLVRVCSRLTHTDPKAEWGAWAVALAARQAASQPPASGSRTSWAADDVRFASSPVLDQLRRTLPDRPEAAELLGLIERAARSAEDGESTTDFAANQGWSRGVTGYTYQTVPVALQAVWRYRDDVEAAIVEVIRCGGDTDSVAAITGGVLGAGVGEAGLPADWVAGIVDWPRSVGYLRRVGLRLSEVMAAGEPGRSPGYAWIASPVRNVAFVPLAFAHLGRRMLPPY